MAATQRELFVFEAVWGLYRGEPSGSLVALLPQPVSSAPRPLLSPALPRTRSPLTLVSAELVRSVILRECIPNSPAHSFRKLRSPGPLEEGTHRVGGELWKTSLLQGLVSTTVRAVEGQC